MSNPQHRITIGSTVYTNEKQATAVINRRENSVDTAQIVLADAENQLYLDYLRPGTAVQVDVKDASETAWTTIFKGVIRFPILLSDPADSVALTCDGAGYGLLDVVAAIDYGSQSSNPTLDTIAEAITDATHGLIPKWANKYFESATDTGFSYTTAAVDTITGTIPYMLFPYKPINKCLDDLCDIVTALKTGSAGPHWIVTTDDALHVKLISSSQAGWTKYYHTTQALSTLTEGVDFTGSQFEPMGSEANCIVYYGPWRRPSSGDSWTYGSGWDVDPGLGNLNIAQETTTFKVGSDSLKIFADGADSTGSAWYPASQDAAWDFTSFTHLNTPNLNFYAYRDAACNIAAVHLYTDIAGDKYYQYTLYNGVATDPLATDSEWTHFSLPVGNFYNVDKTQDQQWTPVNAPAGWSDIKCVLFFVAATDGNALYVDGLHFGGASVCRVAKNSTKIASDKLKVKTHTDNIGKDDSLVGSDDSGLMAQFAYAELLRLQKTSIVGSFSTPMLKDLLPGQQFHVHAKKRFDGVYRVDSDFRVTKLTHTIASSGFATTCEVTDDLTNSHARAAFEKQNRIWESVRPEFQDRQATSQKVGDLDIRITRLEKDYPS